MFTDHNRIWLSAAEMTKNLRGLAIKTFAKCHI